MIYSTEAKLANKVICKFMGSDPWNDYLISRDKGESYCMSFQNTWEANHFLDVENPHMKKRGYEVVEKERWRDYAHLDDLVEVLLRLGGAEKTDVIWISSMLVEIMKRVKSELFKNPKLTIQEAACIVMADLIKSYEKRRKI